MFRAQPRGSGGMLPQETLHFLGHLSVILMALMFSYKKHYSQTV